MRLMGPFVSQAIVRPLTARRDRCQIVVDAPVASYLQLLAIVMPAPLRYLPGLLWAFFEMAPPRNASHHFDPSRLNSASATSARVSTLYYDLWLCSPRHYRYGAA